MTIISNPFARTRRHLPQKYTISTLQSIDIADNQEDYGCILKFYQMTTRSTTGRNILSPALMSNALKKGSILRSVAFTRQRPSE